MVNEQYTVPSNGTDAPLFPEVAGGVSAARGFKAAGVHAGFRKDPNRLDLALVMADAPCAAAAVFTQNVFAAAPVRFSQEQLSQEGQAPGQGYYGTAQVVAINSGNANAATGDAGMEAAREQAQIVADVTGCAESEVLIASTGVIGVPLPLAPFAAGLPDAYAALTPTGGHDAARAIMTTDTYPKEYAVEIDGGALGFSGETFTVGGMAKGSGMIMPNMATMIAVLTTDVPLASHDLHTALVDAVGKSFNKITVDSDTSTNDTCIALSSGMTHAGGAEVIKDAGAIAVFSHALDQVCIHLARMMARDGEGASKLVDVFVEGAATDLDADSAARAIANSPLVKTAIAGRDANWGRIAMAIGKSGATFDQSNVDIDIMGIPVCRAGLALAFDEDEALKRFEDDEIELRVSLGAGRCATHIWTCDLTHDYISINADYRS